MSKMISRPAFWILVISLIFSLVNLVVYLAESGFSDETLFYLLAAIRYSSFFALVCSIYLLVYNIIRIVNKPSAKLTVAIILLLFCILYSIGLIALEAFLVSISRGI